jgi:uncharacterized repeat protein (TIGR03806 family)
MGGVVIRGWRIALVLLLLLILTNCRRAKGVRLHLDEQYPEKLSDWALFVGGGPNLRPNEGVLAYDVNTPLFVDYASKLRTVWMPPGRSATYSASGAIEFPVGTIFSKTFYYTYPGGRTRLIETRLLVHMSNGWVGLPYVWNEAQSDAMLETGAEPLPMKWTNASGQTFQFDYVIPNVNQCRVCHNAADGAAPLGPTVANLNRTYEYPSGAENQLVHWRRAGYLKGAPPPEAAPKLPVWDDASTGSVDERARAYIEVNCAHCHSERGPGAKSGLLFDRAQSDPRRYGVCKAPAERDRSLGARFDIWPGRPGESALLLRMRSVDSHTRMPDLGRSLAHAEAVALMRQWIAEMPGGCR